MSYDIKKHFPYAQIREQQEKAINFALDSFIKEDKRFVIIEAGTGVGKSAVGLTVGKYLNRHMNGSDKHDPGSWYLTTQKILQAQYVKDFGLKEKMRSVKSARNHKCKHSGSDCKEGQMLLRNADKKSYQWKTCVFECPYKKEKKDFIDEGYRLIQIAEELNPNSNDVQRWKGILWNEYNSKISTKQKIKYLQKVKECWLRAVEINPKDATAFHLLGRWEYGLYSIDWFSRNIAKALFGTLPTSSVENAYNYFKEAENINPGFWLNNKLQLANMCMLHKDDKKEEAKKHYVEALKMKTITEEDKKSLVEVKEKLKKHFPDVFADHIKVEK